MGKVLGRYKVGKHFDCRIGEGSFTWSRRAAVDRAGREAGRNLRAAHQRTGRAAFGGRHRAQLQEPGGSRTSFPLSERASTCWCGRFDIAPRSGCPRTFSYACWPTTWNGICAAPGRRCCSKTKSGGRNANAAIRFCQPNPPIPSSAKKRSHQTADGLPVHSFRILLADLASRARVTYQIQSGDVKVTCQQVPTPRPSRRGPTN